ncbi:MAG: protein of unknown function DUF512 [Candidatus Rokubacteria bacterium]|nr:protein of unknown function DUF512 [Candidatus Rokubacteria bacterium]
MVPVGLTRHRERLPELRTLTSAEALDLARTVEGWQREFREALGTRFVWASDEVYLEAGRPVPAAAAYEGFPVIEDGIGLVRRFSDGFARAARRLPARVAAHRTVTVVTGALFAPHMRRLVDRLSVRGLRVELAPVVNDWFGHGIGVAGLLTGQDIAAQLAGRALGDEVLVPAVAIRDGAGVFLDDLSAADIGARLGVPVRPVETAPSALAAALLGR